MTSFQETGLIKPILEAVEKLGFEKPTPIQELVIPKVLTDNEDLIALAQTGTGKTAAFGLPIIQLADLSLPDVQSLILCPTRELCVQISKDLQSYSTNIKGFSVIPVYGGASAETQISALRKGGQIVVGTPGRVKDLINRKRLKIGNIKHLILDEADEMLNMGFQEDLEDILAKTPEQKQVLLFSATMPRTILRMAEKFMHQPFEISVGFKNAGAENVSHEYYVTHARNRYEVLKRIADINPDIYGIVFCRTRQETKDVADKFMNDGYNADALHGDLSQAQRDFVMNRFRKKHLQMLIATDVAARGLDVDDLTHVINYNLPDDLEVYIHRSGRTGRAGKSGTSISIVHTRENRKIKDLEKLTRKPFTKKLIPGGKEICKKQLFSLIDKVEKVELSDDEIGDFLPHIYNKLEYLSREDLIRHFVSVEFQRFLDYYKNAPDLNVEEKKSSAPTWEKGKRNLKKENFTRFFINLGKNDGLTVPRLIGLINDQTQNRSIEIGKIDLLKNFSFFEVPDSHKNEILKAFKEELFVNERPVSVEVSKPEQGGKGKKDKRSGGGRPDKRSFDSNDDRSGGRPDRSRRSTDSFERRKKKKGRRK